MLLSICYMTYTQFQQWFCPFVICRMYSTLKMSTSILGDKIRGGDKIKERPGHFDDDRKPDDFNTKQIFVSPSIRYAGHYSYATPTMYACHFYICFIPHCSELVDSMKSMIDTSVSLISSTVKFPLPLILFKKATINFLVK